MKPSRVLVALGAFALVVAASVVAAPAASADQIWYQAVGRATAEAPCPTSTSEETSAGWSEWTPSWEEWANGSTGGFVCTRSITWAYESTGGGTPTAGCTHASASEWYDFLGGWSLPAGTTSYSEDTCSSPSSTSGWNLVFTPDGADAAKVLCTTAFGGWIGSSPLNFGYPVYGCQQVV